MMRLILSFLLVSGFKTCLCADDPAWCYNSQTGIVGCKVPDKWNMVNVTCGGAKQSPINIMTSETRTPPTLTELKFTGYDVQQNMKMKNDKRTVSLEIPPGATLTWAQIPYKYRAVRIDFHWGDSDTKLGSEHIIDGERYKVEMQVLHLKDTYTKIEDAQDDPTGVAILAFLIEAPMATSEGSDPASDTASDTSNQQSDSTQEYAELVEAVKAVADLTATETSVNIILNKLFPVDMKNYYYYEGSVTKPGCQPAIWIVLKDRIKLSQTQIDKFYKVKYGTEDTKLLVKNYRPVQPLRGRLVYDGGIPSSGAATLGVSFTFILMCLIAALGCFQLV